MSDWQSIPYDPCTELSPFHNPGIVLKYDMAQSSITELKIGDTKNCLKMHQTRPTIYLSVKLNDSRKARTTNALQCRKINTCSKHCDDTIHRCLFYSFDSNLCIQESINDTTFSASSGEPSEHFICKQTSSFRSVCITVQESNPDLENEVSGDNVHSQALQMLQTDLYAIAVNKCENADIAGHQCYWTPNSIITKRHCSDCPLICRSLKRSLTFGQFCTGAALLMVSIPVAWVPVAGLISNRVHREAQVRCICSW